MKKNQPDQRTRPELPKDPFGDFQYRQALAEEMLPMIGRIYRDNVHLLLYGKPLVNLSVSEIMNAHRFVRETENNEMSEFETYQVIVALSDLELGPAEVDIGIIAAAYLFDDKDLSIEDFVKESVNDLIGTKGSILEQAQDVVLYGFGRWKCNLEARRGSGQHSTCCHCGESLGKDTTTNTKERCRYAVVSK